MNAMRCPEPFWFRAAQGSAAGFDPRIIPAGFDPVLGFEPFDSAHGPEYVGGSQRLEFLTGSRRVTAATILGKKKERDRI